MKKRFALILAFCLVLLAACAPAQTTAPTLAPAQSAESEAALPLSAASQQALESKLIMPSGTGVDGYVETDITDSMGTPKVWPSHTLNAAGEVYGIAGNFGERQTIYCLNQQDYIWEEVPGYNWLSETEELKQTYNGNFLILSDGTYAGMWSGLKIGTIDRISTFKILYADANGYQKTVETGEKYWDDTQAVFDEASGLCMVIEFEDPYNEKEHRKGVVYDYRTGKKVCTLDIEAVGYEDICILDGKLYCFNFGHYIRLDIFDLHTGELLRQQDMEELQSKDNLFGLKAGATRDGNGFVIAASNGLIYMDKDSLELTKLGKIDFFDRTQVGCYRLHCLEDGSVLVYCKDVEESSGHYLLFRYMDAIPVKESDLSVFSLEEDQVVRGAAVHYGEANGIDVNFIVGTEGGVLAEDAMRTLSAQILAGAGPDVLVLDGLPIQSYIEKGALMDISHLLPENAYENITEGFRQPDGSVPAIPARFEPLMLLGNGVKDVHTLPQLSAWMAAQEIPDVGIGTNGQIPRYFPFFAHNWIKEGAFQSDVFREDLIAMGEMAKMWRENSYLDNEQYRYNNSLAHAGAWYAGLSGGGVFAIEDMGELNIPYEVLKTKKGELAYFSEDTYLPRSVVGISAGAAHKEQAEEFVRSLFTEEAQSVNLQRTGLPVRRDAMQALLKKAAEDKTEQVYPLGWMKGAEGLEINTGSLGRKFADQFATGVEKLTIPALVDQSLEEIFYEMTLPYLHGEQDLDSTMQQLQSRLAIYLAE